MGVCLLFIRIKYYPRHHSSTQGRYGKRYTEF
ncbi:Bgt-20928 [Blumeria graminis f. sp. tritici]|uniref:Bgt-20928 n=1 Tax=Blumeria graminis f. sp. tritici TaxID=62690 RepID=A0A9X9L9D9_BLUGR|nr:Bgt-20928 [Blumeria graminis f. sp. tritici]